MEPVLGDGFLPVFCAKVFDKCFLLTLTTVVPVCFPPEASEHIACVIDRRMAHDAFSYTWRRVKSAEVRAVWC